MSFGLSTDDDLALGKELASVFQDKLVHPVFIFGSKGSGKTTLIASILKYIQDREEASASIELAEDVLPPGDQWAHRLSASRDLFYRKVFDYMENAAPPSTQEEWPFFVPVRLIRATGEEVVFAFLEGKGEWYHPDETSEVPFQPFKGLLQGMLLNFNEPATFIYVAPFATESFAEHSGSNHLAMSDKGLLGVLTWYQSLRKAHAHHDHHMLMVSKWDIFCESPVSPEFVDPTADEIQNVLRDRYPLTWNRYLKSTFSAERQNRSFSAYCSGLMTGSTIASVSGAAADNVAFFPRKFWDWMYENATGQVLYPDVRPAKPTLLDRLLNFLRG
jgi:hypothetical protein